MPIFKFIAVTGTLLLGLLFVADSMFKPSGPLFANDSEGLTRSEPKQKVAKRPEPVQAQEAPRPRAPSLLQVETEKAEPAQDETVRYELPQSVIAARAQVPPAQAPAQVAAPAAIAAPAPVAALVPAPRPRRSPPRPKRPHWLRSRQRTPRRRRQWPRPKLRRSRPRRPSLRRTRLRRPKLRGSRPRRSKRPREAAKPETTKPETAKLETAKPAAPKTESAKIESTRIDSAKIESTKTESAKLESTRTEAPVAAPAPKARKQEAERLRAPPRAGCGAAARHCGPCSGQRADRRDRCSAGRDGNPEDRNCEDRAGADQDCHGCGPRSGGGARSRAAR